jgi:hypothetical protein
MNWVNWSFANELAIFGTFTVHDIWCNCRVTGYRGHSTFRCYQNSDTTRSERVSKPTLWREEDPAGIIPVVVTLIIQEEGFQGFFKGMSPRLARKVISAAIVWTGYEEILKAIARRKIETGQ